MNCTVLNEPFEWTRELSEFERNFQYPLGKNSFFRISHGDDYTRFFRALGKSTSLVSTNKQNSVCSSISIVRRNLYHATERIQAYYLADLKVLPKSAPSTLFRLLSTGQKILPELKTSPLYCVVMQGTERTPDQYSGRLGLPQLTKLGEIAIFRMESTPPKEQVRVLSTKNKASAHRPCPQAYYFESQGHEIRSKFLVQKFSLGSASCLLEDTLRAKNLFDQNDQEIISGHISSLRYQKPQDAIQLLSLISRNCPNYPALFFSVPIQDHKAFAEALPKHSLSFASIYGTQLKANQRWFINTAEI